MYDIQQNEWMLLEAGVNGVVSSLGFVGINKHVNSAHACWFSGFIYVLLNFIHIY